MIVKVFAGLKDHFEVEFQVETCPTISELRAQMLSINPASAELLTKCRFAVNNAFVGEDESLENVQEVLVMPPSSGG